MCPLTFATRQVGSEVPSGSKRTRAAVGPGGGWQGHAAAPPDRHTLLLGKRPEKVAA